MKKTFESVYVGRTQWYWVKEDKKVYKCKYAATGEATAANGEEKDVIEYNGKFFVKFGKTFTCIA